ncbi:cyclin-dependent kinase inhibitor 3-like [Notothenia coriiceps]|uniref:protein-tyrosine-phosphatase n=1 Tax=Notothenia coriiceps TaxID=8208 RepID=A0A6I9PAH1_9TELE|nr:PREDICTED: cyclin-dependent kinase inhibitor 3-like [Notothenia coriiceps]
MDYSTSALFPLGTSLVTQFNNFPPAFTVFTRYLLHFSFLFSCYGGLGRSGLIAACLLLQLSVTMTPNKAIEILREHRGGGAIQTVKQYNFLHEFRERFAEYQQSREVSTERRASR